MDFSDSLVRGLLNHAYSNTGERKRTLNLVHACGTCIPIRLLRIALIPKHLPLFSLRNALWNSFPTPAYSAPDRPHPKP